MSTALSEMSMRTVEAIRGFDEFSRQPSAVVSDVLSKIGWIQRHNDAAHRSKGAVARQAAAALNCSVGAFLRYKANFRRENWKGIMDKRISAGAARGLHPSFKSFVAGLFDPLQRDLDDGMEAWRDLLDKWNLWKQTGDPKHRIPGYDVCPSADPVTGYPVGWSYDNILRLRPTQVERALSKHGKKNAAKFLPPVLTTRVGSAVLSRRLYDDQDLDTLLADGFLAIAGIDSTSRPVSFNCVDFFTGRHVDAHLRMMFKDADKDTNKTLTGMEFVWFHIKQLQADGWRTDDLGSEHIFEHGTANSWANKAMISLGGHASYETALEAITGGKCFVNRSGKFEGAVFAEMCFRTQSTGNFKFKTWIESSFRLLRTYMQGLPGPIGSNQRLNGKDEIYGIKLAENQMLKAIATCEDKAMQEFLVESFRHELLDLPTFARLIDSVYRAINLSTHHKLEGWQQLGFTVPLWRLNENSDNWFTQDDLTTIATDPMERQLILRKINSNREALTRNDLMSRQAAWDLSIARDKSIIRKLPDSMVGMLLPLDWAKKVTLASNHTFTLQNPLWKDTRETYVASWEERGAQVTLDGGKDLLVFHNPFFDGRAHVHSLDGSYITTLYPTVRATPFDAAAKLEQLKIRSKVSSQHEAHLRARMADIGAQRTADTAHNKSIILLTREDRRRAAAAKQSAFEAATSKRAETAGQAADDALALISAIPQTTQNDDLDF